MGEGILSKYINACIKFSKNKCILKITKGLGEVVGSEAVYRKVLGRRVSERTYLCDQLGN